MHVASWLVRVQIVLTLIDRSIFSCEQILYKQDCIHIRVCAINNSFLVS